MAEVYYNEKNSKTFNLSSSSMISRLVGIVSFIVASCHFLWLEDPLAVAN
jgi:hypothetical protein